MKSAIVCIMFSIIFTDIDGTLFHSDLTIGEKTKEKLLQQFKSVKRIKETSLEELAAHIGETKAKILTDALKQQQ